MIKWCYKEMLIIACLLVSSFHFLFKLCLIKISNEVNYNGCFIDWENNGLNDNITWFLIEALMNTIADHDSDEREVNGKDSNDIK